MTRAFDAMRSELNAAMTGAERGVPAADELCSTCVDLFGVDGAALSVVHDGATRGTFGSSSEASRRLDEYQFTFGEGPCLDAVAARQSVLVPDLDSALGRRWPAFAGAALADGIRGVFALPVVITSVCVGALDLFRVDPGPLQGNELEGALLAAELAAAPLLDLVAEGGGNQDDALQEGSEEAWGSLEEMDRIEVYQATGMLISQLDVDAAEALARLRAHAVATGQTASQVAWAIVERRLVLERDDHGPGRGQG
ncbi:GAF domain-containing protein [Nocardioides euryhalodurans]|uniref:GAF domain-containing protein n=1 Tax=Nocardioides euryhalodurans TaxID=2518370 RepID=A0A4P7GHA4_9ACTN|nr:GAF domain-containing protein [Nocardioides euryhalodurans]QBR91143.1 GAF domain-containing protein [Nocardioides euryhalodurans]